MFKLTANSINELRKELHVFDKGSFFNEGEYNPSKIMIRGNFYEYSDTYSNNVLVFQQISQVQFPLALHDKPKFRTAAQIVPFFTEGKIKS